MSKAPASRYALDDRSRRRVAVMLDMIADERRACKACGRTIWIVKIKGTRRVPITDDAVSHFADCPHAEQFRGKR